MRIYDEKQNEIKTDEDVTKRVKAYKKTSLNSSVHIFEEFLRKLEMTWKGRKIEISGKLLVMFHCIITYSLMVFSLPCYYVLLCS